jgi:hypothetical protein
MLFAILLHNILVGIMLESVHFLILQLIMFHVFHGTLPAKQESVVKYSSVFQLSCLEELQ